MVIKRGIQIIATLMMFCGGWFGAQNNELSEDSKFKSRTYEINEAALSPNGKYITFQKAYEYSGDTLTIVSAESSDKVIYETTGIWPSKLSYTGKGYLFMTGDNKAELLRLPRLETLVWSNIENAAYLEKENKLAVLQNRKLKIYDAEGSPVDEIAEVTDMKYRDFRLFYTQQQDSYYHLKEWKNGKKRHLFTALHPKLVIDFCHGNTLFIHEENAAEEGKEIIFIDQGVSKSLLLQKRLGYPIHAITQIAKLNGSKYFLRLITKLPKTESTSVDIWYHNDNRLEEKFKDGLVVKYMIWDAEGDSIKELDDKENQKYLYINNPNFLLSVDPTLHQRYSVQKIPYEMYRYDAEKGKNELLGITGIYGYVDRDGRNLLSYDNQNWVLYNILTKQKRVLHEVKSNAGWTVKGKDLPKPYFDENGRSVLFDGKDEMYQYTIDEDVVKKIKIPEGFRGIIINGNSSQVGMGLHFTQNYFNSKKPLLIKLMQDETSRQGVGVFKNGKFSILLKSSDAMITVAKPPADPKKSIYTKSNYNLPPTIFINDHAHEKIVFRSNPADQKSSTYRMEKVYYKNSRGVFLTGLLYYPSQHNSQNKYPLIVGIYELMRNQSNRYLRDGFSGSVEGMNIRYYLDRGYFIYLPDIVYDSRGPGRSSLDCVESSLEALGQISTIDFGKVGLIGHSHGGYETNFIATQSKRFAAYVSGAGNSDLVRSYHSYNYNFKSPFYWQFEEQQYRMYKPFAADKNLYIDNSPIYHAEKVGSPVLLWAGTRDENIAWDQSMEFYLGLRRNNRKVAALFYKDEGHSFGNKKNREDLFTKISDWFDYHLKGIKNEWTDKLFH